MLPFVPAVEAYLVIFYNLPQPISAFLSIVLLYWFIVVFVKVFLDL